MIFLSPLFFSLLLLTPIIVYLSWRERRKGVYFRGSKALSEVYKRSEWKYFYLPLVLKILIFSLFVCIAAEPVLPSVKSETSKKGIDIAIVFDISKSMLAEDIPPNRIGSAKKVISDFITKFNADRLSVVLFAGKPFLSTPLTFDYGALKNAVENITTDSIRQEVPGLSGTAIGDGLLVAIDTLEHANICPPEKGGCPQDKGVKREKVIILLTDGEANMGVNPKSAAKLAGEKGIKIYTIGLGDPKGTELYVTDQFGNRQYFRDQTGTPIKATLDEKMLTFMAETTGGKYYNAKDEKALSSIFDTLGKLTKTEIKTTSVRTYAPRYEPFLYAILILFPAFLFITRRNYSTQ